MSAGFLVLWLAIFAVIVVALDLLQYVAATKVAEKALKDAEHAANRTAKYDDQSFAYKAQVRLYQWKFVALVIGGLLLAVIFVWLFMVPIAEPAAMASSPTVCCKPCAAPSTSLPSGQTSSH